MTKYNKLRIESLEACNFRNHKMSRFRIIKQVYHSGDKIGFSICSKCSKSVYIDTNPAPNGIDIAGEAVALNCN